MNRTQKTEYGEQRAFSLLKEMVFRKNHNRVSKELLP